MQQRATATVRLATLAGGVLILFGAVDARAGDLGEYPRVGAEAMAYYEARVEDWADGPAGYLLLDDEREIWESLQTAGERQAFIDWFWVRRDDDPRDARNPFKIEFYERVARANQRFHGLPRGWRSDRGRVLVILGRPDGIRNRLAGATDAQVWTYYTTGRDRAFGSARGEMTVLFARIRGNDYDIAGGFAGPGSYPYYLQQAFEYTRAATVVDPFLELARTSHRAPSRKGGGGRDGGHPQWVRARVAFVQCVAGPDPRGCPPARPDPPLQQVPGEKSGH